MDAKSFYIIKCVVQRMDFQFAAIARTRIDLPDGQTVPKAPPRGLIETRGECGEFRVRLRPRLGQWNTETFAQEFQHRSESFAVPPIALTGRDPNKNS